MNSKTGYYEDFDRFPSSSSRDSLAKNIIFHLPKSTSLYLLDLGCGCGDLLSKLYKPRGVFFGVDVSMPGISKAKKLLKDRVNLIRANLFMTPFKKGIFNVITFTEVLEHLENQENALREICRISSKDSIVVITVPYAMTFHIIRCLFQGQIEVVYSLIKKGFYEDRKYRFNIPLHRYYTKRYLKKIVEENGFDVIDCKIISYTLFRNITLGTTFFIVLKKNDIRHILNL